MSNLIYEIIKYQIYKGSHNEEVSQLTEQYVNLKFLNSLIYKTIHEKIMKTKTMYNILHIYYQLPVLTPSK